MSMYSGGLGLTKLIYTRLEDNLIRHLIRHRGDRYTTAAWDAGVVTGATGRDSSRCRYQGNC